jgi:hypothetical protein
MGKATVHMGQQPLLLWPGPATGLAWLGGGVVHQSVGDLI